MVDVLFFIIAILFPPLPKAENLLKYEENKNKNIAWHKVQTRQEKNKCLKIH